jgi:FkbM family methyltransferase
LKQIGGVWLPDNEQHLVTWMQNRNEVVDGKLTYQYHKLQAALLHVKQFRCAVDVGAHCGLWSMHLARRFNIVHAFEPVAAHRECFMENVPHPNALLYAVALGDTYGRVAMQTAPSSSGDTTVVAGDEVSMMRLDDYDIGNVDFIKLDCEGYELNVLKGARETLIRCRPCVIVEQKPGKAQQFGLGETEAVDYLEALGAKLRTAMSGDFILAWDE